MFYVGIISILFKIYIWDKINVMFNFFIIVRVGEEIVFEFLNVFNLNFFYEI